jgi:hypothetical protein
MFGKPSKKYKYLTLRCRSLDARLRGTGDRFNCSFHKSSDMFKKNRLCWLEATNDAAVRGRLAKHIQVPSRGGGGATGLSDKGDISYE